MCSHFLKRMDNYQGDLTDIIRATATKTQAASAAAAPPEWQFPISNNPGLIYTTDPGDDFGDPFTHLRDPLIIHGIENPVSGFLHHSDRDIIVEETAGINGGTLIPPPSANVSLGHKVLISHEEQMIKRPNMFSRMLQIAPNAKPTLSPCDSPAAPHQSLISPNSSKVNCLVESSGLQISSPRNTGIRRRKSQAKKVVCIPAPAPANSRSSGEVVPSDLWAWRKYGQKPIKGSPYPRGYYRCSSSKGCSARKQVERSRTDPNMLVITYTSEHNHPWPTQRNALAGSTRSQPSKNNNNTSSKASQNLNKLEEEHHTKLENTVKQEIEITAHEQDNNFDSSSCHHIEMEDDAAAALSVEFDQGFDSYKPTLPQSEDNFFADLGEIDCDPLDILLTQGFSGEDGQESKDILDPFTFYDWANNNNNNHDTGTAAATSTTRAAAATSYGEPKNNDSSSSS